MYKNLKPYFVYKFYVNYLQNFDCLENINANEILSKYKIHNQDKLEQLLKRASPSFTIGFSDNFKTHNLIEISTYGLHIPGCISEIESRDYYKCTHCDEIFCKLTTEHNYIWISKSDNINNLTCNELMIKNIIE